jgi:hypothetical protein
MAYWSDHSLLVAMQSAFGTPNIADGDAIKCELPSISFETEVVELDLLTGQPGAEPERMPGARGGTISFSIPLEGFKEGYTVSGNAPAADPGATGVIPLWLSLLANAMGSNLSAVSTDANFKDGLMCSVSQYTSGGVTSATSTAITLDNSTASDKIDVGQLVCTATSASSTSLQLGFCKTKAAQVCTLFEDAGTIVNSASANVYGTATAYASAEYVDQKPLTLMWTGPDAAFCYVLQDCITESVRITWEAQAVPTAEFTMRFYNYSMNKTLGGLVAPDSFNRVPQIVGNNNGRATINGVLQCGLESCTWEWTATFTPVKCHSSSQGTSAVLISKPRIRASFSVLHDSNDVVYDAAGGTSDTGSHKWQSFLERQSVISIATYVGTVVGRVWAQLIPAGRIIEVPAVEFRGENSVAYTIQVGAGAYTGDTTDKTETAADSPLDSISRQSLA